MSKHDTRNRIRLFVCLILAIYCFWVTYATWLNAASLIMGMIGLVFVVGGIVGFQDRS